LGYIELSISKNIGIKSNSNLDNSDIYWDLYTNSLVERQKDLENFNFTLFSFYVCWKISTTVLRI